MLSYPLDAPYLLRKRASLRDAFLASSDGLHPLNIAILCGSTVEPIADMLELFLLDHGVKPSFHIGEYNRYYEEAMFDNSALASFKPDIIYLHLTAENMTQSDDAERLPDMWNALHERYGCAIIQNTVSRPATSPLGALDIIEGRNYELLKLNLAIIERARACGYVHLHDAASLFERVGSSRVHDASHYYASKLAISPHYAPEFAWSLSRLILAQLGASAKCLALDADNTLWGGVIGDDGVAHIAIGEGSALSECYKAFQTYIKALKDRGVILAIISKNELSSVHQALAHPESVLKPDDFAAIIANWDDKAQNMALLAEHLNIGLDAMVFVDDNPAERARVADSHPHIAVPNMGDDPFKYLSILDSAHYFDSIALSDEDSARSELYQANAKRSAERAQFTDYNAYLKSLEMRAELSPLDDMNRARALQLINKTNQFNLTTKRLQDSDLETYLHSDGHSVIARLADKFGDNGIVSVLLARVNGDSLHIDNWVMSCRVFKRELERAMLDALVNEAKTRGVSHITLHYIATAKNKLLEETLGQLGFTASSDQSYSLAIETYHLFNPPIRIA